MLARDQKRISSKHPEAPELIEHRCDRWIYAWGDYRIIVRLKNGRVRSGFTSFLEGRVPSPLCLERSTNELSSLVSFADNLIAKGKVKHGARWDDPYDGAAAWVRCTEKEAVIEDSLSTLLHELNHGQDKPECIHEPVSGKHLCFEFSYWLPDAEYAAIDMDQQPESVMNYERGTQELYLEHNDIDLLQMLDELVCYRIDTDVQTAITRKRGSVYLKVGNSSSRSFFHMELFMLYTVRYLDRLRREKTEQYIEYFADGSQNLANIHKLLALCETSYEEWRAELKKHDEAPGEHQRLLWDMYKAKKRNWLNEG